MKSIIISHVLILVSEKAAMLLLSIAHIIFIIILILCIASSVIVCRSLLLLLLYIAFLLVLPIAIGIVIILYLALGKSPVIAGNLAVIIRVWMELASTTSFELLSIRLRLELILISSVVSSLLLLPIFIWELPITFFGRRVLTWLLLGIDNLIKVFAVIVGDAIESFNLLF